MRKRFLRLRQSQSLTLSYAPSTSGEAAEKSWKWDNNKNINCTVDAGKKAGLSLSLISCTLIIVCDH